MRQEFLKFAPPAVGEEEIAAVLETMRSGWITTGPKVKQFEETFANFLGAPAALAVNSCTSALHLALWAHGIKEGDEVITTPLTFVATVNVIEHVNATPVFVDVEPDTLNICPDAVEAAITPKTKAVLAVHYAGHPADMTRLKRITEKHGIKLVVDAAHALPASCDGVMVGGDEILTGFSFYATKNLTTAEGGMLTGSEELIEKARIASLHGMSRDAWKRYDNPGAWFYEVVTPGFKYNMTDIQAAIGLTQMSRLSTFQGRRHELVHRYSSAFENQPALRAPVTRPGIGHAWHLYVLRLREDALRIGRNEFITELAKRNIGSSVHFIPIHKHPYYADRFGPQDVPVAEGAYESMLSLPLHPGLTDQDQDDVITEVIDLCREFAA